MAYIGNSPGVASQRVVTTFTATAGQTTFTPSSGYTLGYCDVFYNGVKLVNGDDYTASNGTSVVLASAAAAGDSVEIVAHFPRGLSDGYLKAEADARYPRVDTASQGLNSTQQSNARTNIGAQAALGYTPVNKAGDTMTGLLRVARGSQAQRDAFQIHVSGGINDGFYDAISWYQGSDANTLSATLASLRTVYTNSGRGELEWWSRQEIEKVGGSPYLRVDQHGRVTTPFQPAFRATLSTDSTLSTAQVYSDVGGTWSAPVNVGSHYNTSTRRFTAPVTGSYFFSAIISTTGGAGTFSYLSAELWVNGSRTFIGGWDGGGPSYGQTSSSTVLYLNQGDYVMLGCETSKAFTMQASLHTSLSGYLIG